MTKEVDSPKVILRILEEKFPHINFPEKYSLVKDLSENGKEVPGKTDGKIIEVNPKFNNDSRIIIFLHECLHFIFYYNSEKIRKDILPKFFCAIDKKESAANFEGYKDCEDLIVKYATYVILKNNLNRIDKSEEDIKNVFKNIEGFLDNSSGERYFYPMKDWFSDKKNSNNLTNPDKFKLICLSLYYDEKIELFDNVCSPFKDNMPNIELAVKELINKF